MVAVVLCAASLAVFGPGYATYDTAAQYGQVLSGEFDDWHPPAMARLWGLLFPLAAGAAPMLALQLATYWLGLGLLAAATGGRAGAAVLGVGLLPPFLGWQAVVLKDAQMTGALLAAVGLVGWWRLRDRRMPVLAAGAAGVLIIYATLVRANAVFASVPLAVLLVGRPHRPVHRAALMLLGVSVVLALSPAINHGLLGAGPSGVERTQALYDLSGIAVRASEPAHTGLRPAEVVELRAKRCVQPFFWDPLGNPDRCEATIDRLREQPARRLYLALADAVIHHPLAYAEHRAAHLNSTERWWVPLYWGGADPPLRSEASFGLASPGRLAGAWQRLAGWLVETPLGWPIAWAALALAASLVARQRAPGPRRDMAAALLASAVVLEASFAAISIASDLRYHLWPMIATALARVLLLADGRPSRRAALTGAALLTLVVGTGLVARWTLPLPPQTYAGMLG